MAVGALAGATALVAAGCSSSTADGDPAGARAGVVTPEPSQTAGGESLILVLAGVYDAKQSASRAQARAASELSTYYVASAEQFQLLATYAVGPTTTEVTCDAASRAAAAAELPEVALLGDNQLRHACAEAGGLRADTVLEIPITARLERTPLATNPVELPKGSWLRVAAFRTKAGAEVFLDYIRRADREPEAVVQVRRVAGTSDIGLGQEAHPDGSGPLTTELPDQETQQR